MKISYQQAREFLEKINEKDNVMIFTHKDLDGFVSGIMFLEFCKKKGAKVEVRIIDFGISKISETDLTGFNKILLADLAPGTVWEDFEKLKDKEILYTDHHPAEEKSPIPEFVLELRTTNEGYIPSSRTCYELTEKENKELKWLSVVGVLSDMGQLHEINKKFLEDFYKESGEEYNFYSALMKKINSLTIYFDSEIDKGFLEFSKLKRPEDISKIENYNKVIVEEFMRLSKEYITRREKFGEIIYFEFESKFPAIKSSLVTSISLEESNKIFIFVTTKKDSLMSISARNQSREYDASKLIQECLNELKGGFAGGHKAAAGGQVDKSDLEKFKERLKQIKIEDYKI